MNIKIIESTPHGTAPVETEEFISQWQFAKHLAFAGIGTQRGGFIPFRIVAQFIDFFQYWDDHNDCFCLPPVFENDPTEKNFVSNRIGKALADFCAKKYSGAIYTHCYEDAMSVNGHKIRGERPDFYCDTGSKQFAIEAKGFSRKSISENEMLKHKIQSGTGPISVHFTIASVAYDLYSSPKVKYYDPPNDGVEYDSETNLKLRSNYYTAILRDLKLFPFRLSERSFQDDYFEYPIVLGSRQISVIIHEDIIKEKWKKKEWLEEFKSQPQTLDFGFIDVDGIGVRGTSDSWNK